MIKLSQKYQRVLAVILENGTMPSSDVHNKLIQTGEDISLITVKRLLSEMTHSGVLVASGSGRSTSYNITITGRLFSDINVATYCCVEPDKRYGANRYNFDLFTELPRDIFTNDELEILNSATVEYRQRTKNLPTAIQQKELERLIIEMSWKSSKIEGNTYTLLDTEKLILENREAPGHDKKEAQMILNHRDAFNYIYENATEFKQMTRKNMEELHAILVKDLSVGLSLRTKPVGVLGSIYRPLSNPNENVTP